MIESVLVILVSLVFYAKFNVRKVRALILCTVSTFIYWQFVGLYCLLLPFIATVTWLICLLINKHKPHGNVLITIYIVLLAVSFLIFKMEMVPIYLPVGFSILCFSGISLVVDYSKKRFSISFLDIYVFLSFFPKILAGPIERFGKFIPQLQADVTINKIYRGCKIILLCIFAKYIIVEFLTTTRTSDVYGINQVIDIFVFAAQFYLDFWAYSNLAIGIALLFGINLSVNFNKPYRAGSFHDFWHRWNITLSIWLRDYLYIPLGGSRDGFPRYAVNVLIVFIVSAFWHDIALTFLLWGAIHAFLLIAERKLNLSKSKNIAYSVLVVIISASLWQLFRCNSLDEISSIISNASIYQEIQAYSLISLAVSVLCVILIDSKFIAKTIFQEQGSKKAIINEVVLVTILGIITLLGMNLQNSSPFFYLAY
ncbi:MAG: MBOAT family protein [Bacteroides heparinolyticus]|nr:MBOAT family protein [Bacteroides heparinolyticus]